MAGEREKEGTISSQKENLYNGFVIHRGYIQERNIQTQQSVPPSITKSITIDS